MDSLKHRKEKTEMILEPMQVMIQLALLSFCPLGTKISVSSNILYLQLPTFYQGAVRWYQNDTKDDLHYLFHSEIHIACCLAIESCDSQGQSIL